MFECILCNSNNYIKFCDIKFKKFDVLICKTCSLTRLNPLPTQEELDNFYKETYREQYSKQFEVSNEVIYYEQSRADRVVSIVKKYFNDNYKYILDIGCSSGTLLKYISKLSCDNPELYGIEMNENYKKYIVNTGLVLKERLFSDDIENFYINRDEKFDFISMVHVLEHLRNPKLVLASVAKMLSRDGLLYVEVPNLNTPYNNLKKQYFAIYHLYYFTEKTLKLLLINAGFEIIHEQRVAKTSVCFVCKKNIKPILFCMDFNLQDNYNYLSRNLTRYLRLYPIIYLKNLFLRFVLNFLNFFRIR